ncbi:MAG: Asp-tRNA(Asn)/Glu-tRNA(Gln) amidotransferase subunit GatC [Kiritimatiellia bacterium]|nr:Asp-tRNA(Asn)/Glu-tRNA(Gln) amidotransferase subunit GatC [Lentisphaerota bacterium]
MAAVSRNEIKGGMDVPYVARLARLHLTTDEVKLFQSQLEQIVDYVRQLEEVDVTGVEPMAHTTDRCNFMRTDEPRPGLARELVLENAPQQHDGQFLVPKIV